jgi:hypothetical protein
MSMPSPNRPGDPRMSRTVKLVLMGVAGAALLYSCAPGVGAGLGALPYLWFLPNPFYRPPIATPCPPGTPSCDQQATTSSGSGSRGSSISRGSSGSTTTDTSSATPSQSHRGGFGSTGSGSSGTS